MGEKAAILHRINLAPGRAFVTFNAAQIGMDDARNEGISIQVPNSIMRLRMQGAGVKYVHGGAALQEIVVPVLHVSKGRSAADDVRPVEFTILQRTDRLSSRQLTVEFFQNEPVGGKIRARTVLAGLWGAIRQAMMCSSPMRRRSPSICSVRRKANAM